MPEAGTLPPLDLAHQLDDPRQHQLLEYLIAAAGQVEAQHPANALQRVGQAAHPGAFVVAGD
jgi:hypothetical protein